MTHTNAPVMDPAGIARRRDAEQVLMDLAEDIRTAATTRGDNHQAVINAISAQIEPTDGCPVNRLRDDALILAVAELLQMGWTGPVTCSPRPHLQVVCRG